MNARAYLAELLGTFMFMMVGYMSVPALHAAAPAAPNLLVVPFSFGFGLLAAIFAFGHISGGHFNPAVTVGIVLDRRLPALEGVFYIVAQIIGAIAAAVVVMLTVSQQAVADGITKPGAGITDISALVIETIFTAIFLVVILVSSETGTADRRPGDPADPRGHPLRDRDGHRFVREPGRSIGSALVGGDLNQLWIYLVGPTVGGIIGWAVYRGHEQPGRSGRRSSKSRSERA